MGMRTFLYPQIMYFYSLTFASTHPPKNNNLVSRRTAISPLSALLQSVAIATLHTQHHKAGCASSSGQPCQPSSLRVTQPTGLKNIKQLLITRCLCFKVLIQWSPKGSSTQEKKQVRGVNQSCGGFKTLRCCSEEQNPSPWLLN